MCMYAFVYMCMFFCMHATECVCLCTCISHSVCVCVCVCASIHRLCVSLLLQELVL